MLILFQKKYQIILFYYLNTNIYNFNLKTYIVFCNYVTIQKNNFLAIK